MRGSSPDSRRATPSGDAFSIDVAILVPRRRQLGVLLADPAGGHSLPWDTLRAGETLDACARRTARAAAGRDPTWIEQVGAFADGTDHPGGVALSVGFVAVLPEEALNEDASRWRDVRSPGDLTERHARIVASAQAELRARMDHAPVAFRLLPVRFTLSELQLVYEILLGRRLHKASFRRALQASWLVEPTNAWRSEGRGRPAQLFRYAPRKRRGIRRGVRFDLL